MYYRLSRPRQIRPTSLKTCCKASSPASLVCVFRQRDGHAQIGRRQQESAVTIDAKATFRQKSSCSARIACGILSLLIFQRPAIVVRPLKSAPLYLPARLLFPHSPGPRRPARGIYEMDFG